MIKLRKKISYLLFIFSAITLLQPLHAISDKVKGLSFASAAIGLAVANEELAESETFEKIARCFNIDPEDLAPCLVFSSALWGASYIPEGAGRIVLRAGAILPIVTAACLPKKALRALIKLPGIRHYFSLMKQAKGLPIIGDQAQCNQLVCAGLCHKCKARKLFLTVPFALIPFVPTIIGSFKATIARWERERIAAVNKPHYDALNIPLDAELTEDVIRAAYRQAMLRTHSDKTGNNTGVAEQLERINAAREALRNHVRKNSPSTSAKASPDRPENKPDDKPSNEPPVQPEPAAQPEAQVPNQPNENQHSRRTMDDID